MLELVSHLSAKRSVLVLFKWNKNDIILCSSDGLNSLKLASHLFSRKKVLQELLYSVTISEIFLYFIKKVFYFDFKILYVTSNEKSEGEVFVLYVCFIRQ